MKFAKYWRELHQESKEDRILRWIGTVLELAMVFATGYILLVIWLSL